MVETVGVIRDVDQTVSVGVLREFALTDEIVCRRLSVGMIDLAFTDKAVSVGVLIGVALMRLSVGTIDLAFADKECFDNCL